MAWKRPLAGGRNFDDVQKDAMIQMLLQGKSKAEVAEESGCSASGLDYTLRVRFKTSNIKQILAMQDNTGSVPEEPVALRGFTTAATRNAKVRDSNEAKYLLWVLQGALAKSDKQSYIDRLIIDIRDGHLG